jgi:predicted CXXCH cytochrome family protein
VTIALGVLAAAWVGCTPQKKYQVLSLFFDGVPDPDAPAASNAAGGPGGVSGREKHVAAYRHKPFVEGTCQPCHLKDMSVDLGHVKDACLSCHPKVEGQYALMHDPVAAGQCLWCHQPHESEQPHLLLADSSHLCVQCHDPQTLSSQTPQHGNLDENCLNCHLGHGGATAALLRPQPATTQAAPGGPS